MTSKLTWWLGHGTLEAEPSNDGIEVFGMVIVKVELDNGFRITEIEIYYEPNEIITQVVGCLYIAIIIFVFQAPDFMWLNIAYNLGPLQYC